MNATNDIIRLEGVRKTYEQGGRRQTVLDAVDASFPEGAVTVLLGKSGSGKSTLLNMLGGIDTADAGRITVAGHEVSAMNDRALTLFRRRTVGYVFQFFHLLPALTVLENVTLPQELDGRSAAGLRAKALGLLDRVGLAHKADAMPETLSGGEQQRVAIVRALAHDPAVLLADEPTGNLDAATGDQVLRLLLELTREAGKTLVIATHSHDVLPHADHVHEVRGGGVHKLSAGELLRQEHTLLASAGSTRDSAGSTRDSAGSTRDSAGDTRDSAGDTRASDIASTTSADAAPADVPRTDTGATSA
ncbi:MAG: ABC transporter ATP-binding protein [Bacteroidetes bacterium]|nr:ABC transporter ATP-binding protein [Bacteroidota bacterium]